MNLSILRALALTGGDWVIYALLLCSVVAVAAIVERGLLFWREEKLFTDLRGEVMGELGKGLDTVEKTVKRHDGAAGRILKTALAQSHAGSAGIEDLLL